MKATGVKVLNLPKETPGVIFLQGDLRALKRATEVLASGMLQGKIIDYEPGIPFQCDTGELGAERTNTLALLPVFITFFLCVCFPSEVSQFYYYFLQIFSPPNLHPPSSFCAGGQACVHSKESLAALFHPTPQTPARQTGPFGMPVWPLLPQ